MLQSKYRTKLHETRIEVLGMYIQLTLLIDKEEGGYAARCKELGTTSCGDSVEEAADNLRDAIVLHLNTLEELGEREAFFRELL
ncbi:MAG: hypothetical protein GC168_11745 [Candidatus Hydrogenedens sp.]|nr:hypothetical protein [Candidatus Hydrogenedens sp.]